MRRKLVDGRVRFHFYIRSSRVKFWEDEVAVPRDPDFFAAYAEATARPEPSTLLVPHLVDRFLASTAMPKGQRSRRDIRTWLLRFAEHFHDAPAAIFQERGSRAEVNRWRAKWSHSPRQHDAAGVHATRLLNWAVEEGLLTEHHCHRLHRLYQVDRSEIVWSSSDIEAIKMIAPEWITRLLTVACETGLRPGDLIKLNRGHIENTPAGRRLRVRTAKRGRLAHIPISEKLAEVIDSTPAGQMLILTNASGHQLTEHRASEGLRQWRDKAGLSSELRLQDCRGTAATRLLNAGLSLSEIANHMGWSIRTAASVIEHYARVSPDETDAVLVKLSKARGGAS